MPARSGLRPLASSRRNGMRNALPPMRSNPNTATALASRKRLSLRRAGATRGSFALNCRTRKSAPQKTETARSAAKCGEFQPCFCPTLRARTNETTQSMLSRAPRKSSFPIRFPSPISRGIAHEARRIARSPMGTLTKKTHCQDSLSVRNPPSGAPTAIPSAPHVARMPMAPPTLAAGRNRETEV